MNISNSSFFCPLHLLLSTLQSCFLLLKSITYSRVSQLLRNGWGLLRAPALLGPGTGAKGLWGPDIYSAECAGEFLYLLIQNWTSGLQEEISVGRNRKSNVKVCDGPNVSRNHLKLVRWVITTLIIPKNLRRGKIKHQERGRYGLEVCAMDGEGLGRPKWDLCQQVPVDNTSIPSSTDKQEIWILF